MSSAYLIYQLTSFKSSKRESVLGIDGIYILALARLSFKSGVFTNRPLTVPGALYWLGIRSEKRIGEVLFLCLMKDEVRIIVTLA